MQPCIAIVEDDQAVREALRRMLDVCGYSTEVFASAEQFLSRMAPARASCLIVDIGLPGMSGLALLNRLVGEGCPIPTILITARPTSGEREQAVATGAVSYLEKPLSDRVLLDTVREALERGPRAAS